MIRRTGARVYTGNHHDLGLLLRQERVSKDHGQFGGSEGNVMTLAVQGSNALLQGKQTLVDFSTF